MIHNLNPKKFNAIIPPKGMQDLASLIAFLSDQKKLEKQFNKLADLIVEVNEAIEIHGKANKIPALLENAEKVNEQAKQDLIDQETKASEALSHAQTRAAEIMTKAKEEAEDHTTQAKQAADKLNKKSLEREKRCKKAEESLAEKQAEFAAKTAGIDKREAKVMKLEMTLAKKESEIKRKQEILSQL